MIKIEEFLDISRVGQLLNDRLAEIEPTWSNIVVSQAKIIKQNVHHDYYNLVAAYEASYCQNGVTQQLTIYCSAHSNESRQQTMDNLKLLWAKNIPSSRFQANWPLFYEPACRAIFYIGLPGQNLFQYFQVGNRAEILDKIELTAIWLARLHVMTQGSTDWPDSRQRRIGQIVPGRDKALEKIAKICPQYHSRYIRIYDIMESRENEHWPSAENLAIIHGDLHPENVVVNQEGSAIIDWADASLADPIRDIGSFSQQLIFMGMHQIKDEAYWQEARNIFEQTYCQARNEPQPVDWAERLKTYYYFTAFRTAIYFVTKSGPEPSQADGLLNEIEASLY